MKIKIPFSRSIQEFLNRDNKQIYSLDQLDKELLDLYVAGKKKAIISFRTRVLEAQLHVINKSSFKIEDAIFAGYLMPRDLVIVSLSTSKGLQYVMQTTVKDLYIDNFILQIRDPRLNERVKFPKPEKILFWQVPPLLMVKLENEHLQIMRDIELIRKVQTPSSKPNANEKKPSKASYRVTDYLTEKNEQEQAVEYKKLLNPKPASAELIDVSLGGMCIRTEKGLGKELDNRFLYLSFNSIGSPSKKRQSPSIKIETFAVVRSYKTSASSDNLHIMFLSHLPEEAVHFFS